MSKITPINQTPSDIDPMLLNIAKDLRNTAKDIEEGHVIGIVMGVISSKRVRHYAAKKQGITNLELMGLIEFAKNELHGDLFGDKEYDE